MENYPQDLNINFKKIEIIRSKNYNINSLVLNLLKGRKKAYKKSIRNNTESNIVYIKNFIANVYRALLYYPDPFFLWYLKERNNILKFAKDKKVNLIFSSSPGATAHLIGSFVAKSLKIPWVADFRDPWSTNIILSRYGVLMKLNLLINRIIEKKTLKIADAITTVTEGLCEDLKRLHNKPTYVIRNGFEPEDFENAESFQLPFEKGKINIVYTGRIYPLESDPSLVFRAVKELDNQGLIDKRNIVFHFWGRYIQLLKSLVTKYNLEKQVRLYDEYLPYKRSLFCQKNADILLLLSSPTPESGKILPAKLFEYLGARRPILAIAYPGGEIDKTLKQTNAGYVVASLEECKAVFLKLYDEFIKKGHIECNSDYDFVLKNYTRYEMTRKLAEIFDKVIEQ